MTPRQWCKRRKRKTAQVLNPNGELTENLPEMKLCFLKWHNLSLLYIWKAVQEQLIKKMSNPLAISGGTPVRNTESDSVVLMATYHD